MDQTILAILAVVGTTIVAFITQGACQRFADWFNNQ